MRPQDCMWAAEPAMMFTCKYKPRTGKQAGQIVQIIPATAGSKVRCKWGIRDSAKHAARWRKAVQKTATSLWLGNPLLAEPLKVESEYVLPRPRNHFGTGKNAGKLKSWAPAFPTTIPDLTKLVRATEDALKRIVYTDDSYVVLQVNWKRFAEGVEGPHAKVTVWRVVQAGDGGLFG